MAHFDIFQKKSFGSSMCWHINLISAKWESPCRSHDLFWVDTSQNLFAKEMLYAILTCAVWWGENRGQLTWRLEDPSFKAKQGCLRKVRWSGSHPGSLSGTCWRFEPALIPVLHFSLLSYSWPESRHNFFLPSDSISLVSEWQNLRPSLSHRFQHWWEWQGTGYIS